MTAALRRALEDGFPILDAKYLHNINEKDLGKIFRGEQEIPLFRERLEILHEIGDVLIKRYNGKFIHLVEDADKDALKLLDIITTNFPSFYDSAQYKGRKIFFHKRAQLAIADIYFTFKGKGFGEFSNVDELTSFADYRIPQYLRELNVLEYSEELARKVDNKEELKSGSHEEIEIRASQIWAIEHMKEILKQKILDINSVKLDVHLWIESKKIKMSKPHHRTRTICY